LGSEAEIAELLHTRSGHFAYESGHHGSCAGSAVRGTQADLLDCGAVPIALAALALLGDSAARFAAEHGLALEALVTLPHTIWAPPDCPLCAAGEPLSRLARPPDVSGSAVGA
jgi:hypothetical protein